MVTSALQVGNYLLFCKYSKYSWFSKFLAALGADLLFDPLNSAKCYRWTSSNLDTLVVSYLNVPFYDQSNPAGSGNNSFQIILSAVDSSITYQYLAQSGVSPQPNYIIGIENNSGVIGLQHSFNFYHFLELQ